MAVQGPVIFPTHLMPSTDLGPMVKNVCKSMCDEGVYAIAPTAEHRLTEQDRLQGATYMVRTDAKPVPRVFAGAKQLGHLCAYEMTPVDNRQTHERTTADFKKAVAAVGNELRGNMSTPYSLKRCFNAEKPDRDAARWDAWMHGDNYVGAYQTGGLDQRYFVIVKSDAGPVLGHEVSQLVAKSPSHASVLLSREYSAAQDASARNNALIAARIAEVGGFNVKTQNDRKQLINRAAFEAPRRLAVSTIGQEYNTLDGVMSSKLESGRYAAYFDGTSPIRTSTEQIMVPINPIDGIRVYHVNVKNMTHVNTVSGIPLGMGTVTAEEASAAKQSLVGNARHNMSTNSKLNATFSWVGRAPDRHDNAELWRYKSESKEQSARIAALLGQVDSELLTPIHVNLPYTPDAK